MKLIQLTDNLAVTAQITPEDLADIAEQGYQVLINNRPDGEENTQPAGQAIAAAAEEAGIEYHYLPITHGTFPGPDFGTLRELLADTSRRTLAFCRSGTRCANLWVASAEDAQREAARVTAREKGFDLGMSSAFIGRDASQS